MIAPLKNSESTMDRRSLMLHRWQCGASEAELATEFDCSETTVRRELNLARATHLLDHRPEYIDSDEFHRPNAEQKILTEPPMTSRAPRFPEGSQKLPAYLRSLYRLPLLSAEEEQFWFRRMNFLKFKANQLIDELNADRPRKRDLDAIEKLLSDATEARNLLVRHNLRLVASIAKKNVKDPAELFERISEGNAALMRSVEKFDYSRGFKLSTYATWAIRKALAGRYRKLATRRDRFPPTAPELLDGCVSERGIPSLMERESELMNRQIYELVEQLDSRDRDVLAMRFGLDDTPARTLHDVGEQIGVSKERVRQIEQRALQRLRRLAINQAPDLAESLMA